jgi:hypothetical protein
VRLLGGGARQVHAERAGQVLGEAAAVEAAGAGAAKDVAGAELLAGERDDGVAAGFHAEAGGVVAADGRAFLGNGERRDQQNGKQ